MQEKIKLIRENALSEIENVDSQKALNDFNVKYLGKQGELTSILKTLGSLDVEQRKTIGQTVNEIKKELENKINSLSKQIEDKEIETKLLQEKIDITEPSQGKKIGAIHPLYSTFNKFIDYAVELGFEVVSGPEIETDYYNFEALNVPKNHPARDMQDTFFIKDNILLRTQTSSVQIREMEKRKPPFKLLVPGRTYRADYDATHTPVFHQLEGLVVDENISMVDLKLILTKLLRKFFGEQIEIRFRPSYFPFTEPSVEVDASCPNCGGKGCKLCKKTGWLELLGAGMVNPKVLENCGIDSKKYIGFAFGIGVDRLSMVENKINDLRMMFENDIRFLSQLR